MPPGSRREFVQICATSIGALLGCGLPSAEEPGGGLSRLSARPGPPTGSAAPGLTSLGLGTSRDGYLYVPQSYDPGKKTPFLLALHGATISAQGPLNLMTPYANSHGFVLLAVKSADYTWDAIRGKYGTDVAFIDACLKACFARVNVDPARVFVSGFSDGASYALGLGLTNGALFSRLAAFSPGFIPPGDSPLQGKPEVYVSHGRRDQILPIGQSSRLIVPALQSEGYTVNYVEFDGPHTVPATIADSAVTWLLR